MIPDRILYETKDDLLRGDDYLMLQLAESMPITRLKGTKYRISFQYYPM
jgi:hypothetical protein